VDLLRDLELMKLSTPKRMEILSSGNKLQQRALRLLASELHTLQQFTMANATFMEAKMMITIN
jgi:hypothetical protein